MRGSTKMALLHHKQIKVILDMLSASTQPLSISLLMQKEGTLLCPLPNMHRFMLSPILRQTNPGKVQFTAPNRILFCLPRLFVSGMCFFFFLAN
jgi:hypothetical protein